MCYNHCVKSIDIPVGTRFGKWTTTSEKFKKDGHVHYSVRTVCECGHESEIKTALITSGRAPESCRDCFNKNKVKTRSLTPEQIVVNYVYSEYRKSARGRALTFHLKKEDMDGWIFENCHYCGRPPQNTYKDRAKIPLDLPKWNGLDRINNDRGYDWNNVVTCCRWCNEAKKAKTTDEWQEWIKGLTENYRVRYWS